MESLTAIGLLKVDFLGIITLDIIDLCLELIAKNRKEHLDIEAIPLDDKKTFEMLARGESKGVFQLESTGMRDILQKLKPDKFEESSRSTPSTGRVPAGGLVDQYIKCKFHPEEISYLHPALEPLLKKPTGYSLSGAGDANRQPAGRILAGTGDNLRKAMGKKIQGIMEEYAGSLKPARRRMVFPRRPREDIRNDGILQRIRV